MSAKVATITGTAIVPGVSRNGRLYTPELLAGAVKRASERLAAGDPITMLTHHGAEDDSSRIVGRVTDLSVAEDGRVRFSADLADTSHGRDIAALVTGTDPFLRNVSIRGAWLGEVRRIQHSDGQMVETGDDLEIQGLDFTKNPGVPEARIGEHGDRVMIFESVDDAVAELNKTPHGDVAYADNGYQGDRVKRYPIDTAEHAREAWSLVSEEVNAARYSPAQLKRVKGRIKAALKRFGVDVAQESAGTTLGEVSEYYDDAQAADEKPAGFCIDAYNGPISISLRGCGIDPADLPAIAAAAMDAACAALAAMDPDADADIDVPGMEKTDDDRMESHTEEVPAVSEATKTDTAPAPADTEEKPMSETQAAPAAPRALTVEDIPALVEAIKASQIAAVEPVAEENTPEPAAPVVETVDVDAIVAAKVAEATNAMREQMLASYGPPRRKGLVALAEGDAPAKPLHEMSTEEFDAYRAKLAEAWIPTVR